MRLIRLKEVMSLTGLGRSSIYKFMAVGTFPQSIALGERAIAWEESEIEEWLQAKIDCRDKATDCSIKKPNGVTEQDVIIFIKDKFKQLSVTEAIEWVVRVTKDMQ